MKRLLIGTVIVLAFLMTSQAYAQEISVYGIYIPGLLTDDSTGPFVEMTKEIGRRANLPLAVKILPPQRQRILFKEKKVDIIFPMVPSGFEEIEYDRSAVFYVKKYSVFTRKDSPVLKTVAALEQLKSAIGLTHGYSYPAEILSNTKLTFDYAPSDDLNFKKLEAGRIDAFIVEESSGVQAVKNLKFTDKVHYDPTVAMFTEDVFYGFQKKDDLREVREAMSQAIEAMKEDGTLQKIFAGPAAVDKEHN